MPGGPGALIDRNAPGAQPLLSAEHKAAPSAAVEDGQTAAVHGVVRWRIVDLCQRLQDEFRVAVSKQTLGRELRAISGQEAKRPEVNFASSNARMR